MIRLTLAVKTLLVYAAVSFVMLTVLVATGYTVGTESDPRTRTLLWITAVGFLLTVVAVVAGMVYVRVKVVGPINRLIDAARRFDRGERDVRVGKLGTGDELDELAEAFDSMVTDITTAWAHLENEVRARTVELERSNRDLVRMNERMAETVRAKSEFLANMSHELRTPMNAVIGYAHCLLDGLDGPLNPDQKADVERILHGAESLLALLNDLLDLSRMEAKRLEVRPEEVPLSQIVNAVEAAIRPQAAAKGLEVQIDVPPDLHVFADPVRSRQILLNLAANAVKFTDKGSVRIAARPEGRAVVIDITDTGMGIPEGDLEKIFDTFYQVDTSQSRRHGGAGLGLAIARRLAELMDGSISVTSEVGRGSTFTVRLPALPSAAAEAAAASAPVVDAGVPTVLAIDDNPDSLELIRRALVPTGFAVVGARSGGEGLRLARLLQPAAITLDIVLPDKDGWEVLRELRADPTTRAIPVFVVSIVDDRPKGYALGAVEYFVKPLDPAKRAALVEQIRGMAGALAGRTVFAVDDDEGDLELVRRVLRDVSCRLLTFRDPAEALRAIDGNPPALVLLDLLMPGMDGFQFLEKLRVRRETRDVPVLVFTAKDLSPDEVRRLRDLSALGVMRKGGAQSDIVTEIRRVLGRREGIRT